MRLSAKEGRQTHKRSRSDELTKSELNKNTTNESSNIIHRPVIHIHIPKVGGQTFGQWVSSALPEDQNFYLIRDLTEADIELVKTFKTEKTFISSHIYGGLLGEIDGFDYVCLFRNPIEQITSHYLHVKRETRSQFFKLVNATTFAEAFEMLPSVFFNYQSLYLVTAFNRKKNEDFLKTSENWIWQNLQNCLDRVNWLGPVENLVEFATLFSLNAKLPIRTDLPSINVKPAGLKDITLEIEAWLKERQHRFALDLLAHEEAKRRFQRLRVETLRKQLASIPYSRSLETRRDIVFDKDERQIRLTEGWYPPNKSKNLGVEHLAGPGAVSRFVYKRCTYDQFIAFELFFVNSIEPEIFVFLDIERMERLSVTIIRESDSRHVFVDLSDSALTGEIAICLPYVYPIGVVDPHHSNLGLVTPFSAGRWRFVQHATIK